MAVVAVGDFMQGTEAVVAELTEVFGAVAASGAGPAPPVPKFSVPSYDAPRYNAFVDTEVHPRLGLRVTAFGRP